MQQQYRRGVDKIVYELPTGWVDKNEKPKKAALRELEEETGYIGRQSKLLGILDAQPGFCTMRAYVFEVSISRE